MKRPRRLSSRAKAALACFILPLATTPIYYGAKEFETIASWYGPGFQGRRTASGQRFDTNQMTAASKTLPFGTSVLVVNPRNGRECEVVINDRGPYVPGRGIDLSHAAARRLGIGGVAPVICYVGGRSYSEMAQKRKHHEHLNGAPDSEPAVPSPSPPEPNEIAQESNFAAANVANPKAVPDHAQKLVASAPPAAPRSTIVSSSDRQQAVMVSEPNDQTIWGRTEQPKTPHTDYNGAPQSQQPMKTEQIADTSNNKTAVSTPLRANEQVANQATKSNQLAYNPAHIVNVRMPESVEAPAPNPAHIVNVKLQPKPVEARATSEPESYTIANILPGTVSDSHKTVSTRKPGTLLAAAERTPYIYAAAPAQASPPVYTYVQYPGRYSVPITSRVIAMPTAQSTTAIRVEPTGRYSRTTSRHYVVAHRVRHRYNRHSHWAEGGDLVDGVVTKVARVCKTVFASL